MDYRTQKVMFSSKHGYHRTPQQLFTQLDTEFHFTLDVCADPNHLLSSHSIAMEHWTGETGLQHDWIRLIPGISPQYQPIVAPQRVYMNPPYGFEITKWLSKAELERKVNGVMTVALLPCRTDTKWWWDFCLDKEVRIIKGRVKFTDYPTGAPFPSCIVIFAP